MSQQQHAHIISSHRVLGVIPARFNSQRFPGKLLATLAGKSVLQRTYENACLCSALHTIVIATDDERICAHAESFGATVVMTPKHCNSGTERIAALLNMYPQYESYSLIVNIQGDEPCIDANALTQLVSALEQDSSNAAMATLIAPITDAASWQSRSIVKCVCDHHGHALYFSRAPIPNNKANSWPPSAPCWRHLGVYAYRRSFLQHYATLSDTPLQLAEDLEQLRVLEHGYSIITTVVNDTAVGVDTPEDLQTLEKLLCTVNSSLSQAASARR
jgi:3-deoxy-manno-octulosonate cytidylyltransferase (CMP-KDO synthetase)